MIELINNMGAWGVPVVIVSIIIIAFIIMQVTGEIMEWCGKVAPGILKVRKYFKERKQHKLEQDKLFKRIDENIEAINNKIDKHDSAIETININIAKLKEDSEKYTKISEDMFIENHRSIIIDFASKIRDKNFIPSKEEFRRVFKIYNEYEEFLKEHGKSNGEIDLTYTIIQEDYEDRLRNKSFLEDIRDCNNKK
jgi:hypothetical protein